MNALKVRKEIIPVSSLAEASRVYQQRRDASGEGCSTFMPGRLRFDGKLYRVSYNGRVWLNGVVVQEAAR